VLHIDEPVDARSIEKVHCLYPIESARVGSILDGTIPAPLPT
jgi:hypothetical protein